MSFILMYVLNILFHHCKKIVILPKARAERGSRTDKQTALQRTVEFL